MRIDIITIFPKMFEPVLNESIIKRARARGLVKIVIHDLRGYSRDKHRKIDDRPFGGGPGMVFCPEPIFRAVQNIAGTAKTSKPRVVLLSPKGKRLDQKLAKRLSKLKRLILICGHYEGVDERVRQNLVTDEISIGDYILTGGELPAMVLVDSLLRLIPRVLDNTASADEESFNAGLLEYPHYTRPAVFQKMKVPKVLLSGNHRLIAQWRKKMAIRLTRQRRPDLLNNCVIKKGAVK